MPQTLTVVQSPIGGAAASLVDIRPPIEEAAREALEGAPVADTHVSVRDEHLVLVLLHDAGDGDVDVHRAAWNALDAGLGAARSIGAPGLGQGLPVNAFPGSLRGTGLPLAEMVLTEQPVGGIVVLLAARARVGLYNLPLARAFADPFANPRLAQSPALRRGFMFEVHDLESPRKRMFPSPAELHDLLRYLADAPRYVLRSVVTPDGSVAAVASSAQRSEFTALAEDDSPIAIVRTGSDCPSTEDLALSLSRPPLVRAPDGAIRPVHQSALVFHVGGSKLLGPLDLLERPGYDATLNRAREAARFLTETDVSQLGPPAGTAPGYHPPDDASRWSER